MAFGQDDLPEDLKLYEAPGVRRISIDEEIERYFQRLNKMATEDLFAGEADLRDLALLTKTRITYLRRAVDRYEGLHGPLLDEQATIEDLG